MLTKNFELSELVKSQVATRYGLNNIPNEHQRENLYYLCLNILQPVRDHFELPVIVSSGFRSPKVNAKVGSSGTSQHCSGQAADFEIPLLPNIQVARWIKENLKFDQLILEFYDGKNENSGWIHCSYSPNLRKQSLVFNGKNYLNWG